MKSLRILGFTALVFAFSPALLAADFGVRAGHYNDMDENFVGAEVLFDLGSINVNPNIEYSLADNVTAGSANVDITVNVGKFSRVSPYVGAGVGIWYTDDNNPGGNTTDLLGNLIGGVQVDLAFLKPYAQVKYFRLIKNDGGQKEDDLALTVGLRF